MTFKTILTIVQSPKDAEATISAAAAFAEANDGHLDILALGVDHTQAGFSYVGAGAVLVQASYDQSESDARAREAAARKVIAEQFPDLRWSIETVAAQIGSVVDVVSNAARFADLVVLPLPYAPGRGLDAEAAIEAALFEGRAPVLVLPDLPLPKPITAPRRIILAWNQSNEALAAARRAMDLLKAADLVSVTVVDPPLHGPERSDPGGLLCQMLVRHGARAEVTVLTLNLPAVSDVLNRHATDIGADLIVMGAYGHSRLREAVLGGATRAMLQKARVPVLMVH
jgi:nucleotide-binding universal stress UspA family protein